MNERITGRDVCDVCRREHPAGADHGCGNALAAAIDRAVRAGLIETAPLALRDVPRDLLAWAVWVATDGRGVPPRVSDASRGSWGAAAYPLFVRITHGEDELRVTHAELLALARG